MKRFIHDETQRIQDERGDAVIRKALECGFELPDFELAPHVSVNFAHLRRSNFEAVQVVTDQAEVFANKFSFVMLNSPSTELAELMRKQIAMMNEVSSIWQLQPNLFQWA